MLTRCGNCFQEYDEGLGLCPYCGYAPGDQPAEAFCLLPGSVIANRYLIGEMLGLGGFGITYKAWDQKLGTLLAVKEYYPSGLVNRQPGDAKVILAATRREREFVYGKARFLEEARNMAKFSTHKNIVNVFDFFEANNTAYIVMEYLDGKTLSQVLQQQNVPLPYDYCVNIAANVCTALKALHAENILHRDVSPDNIMICSNGTVKLFDFGAARFSAGVENRVTVVVKPGFAPPEQYDKINRQDPRTDIYALGATLYYAMTGVKPEESTNRKIEDTLQEPSTIDTSIPANISNAIMRAMALEQQYRFPTVDAFQAALMNGKKVASVKKERAKRKRRRVAGILAALVLVGGAAAAFLYLLNQQKESAGLPDAHIRMWYIQTGDEAADYAKSAALNAIVETFTHEYDNVEIELLPVSSENYRSALEDASGTDLAPAIFESTESDGLGAVSLSEELNKLEGISYYTTQMGAMSQYPTGIIVPVIYVNRSLNSVNVPAEFDDIKSACQQANGSFGIKTDAIDLYAAIYGTEVSSYAAETALEDFLARESSIYLGDSSDYITIQTSLPGEYALLMPGESQAVYRYGTTWSISEGNQLAVKSAAALISYLNSSFAQDYLHIQNTSPDLPITKSSLAEFIELYEELQPVADYLDRPFVLPVKDIVPNSSSLDNPKDIYTVSLGDVPEDAWYAEAVSTLCGQGILNGIDERTFAPDRMTSKATVIVSLYRMAGLPNEETQTPFSDVSSGTELGNAAAWAYNVGITSDSGDGLFHGEDPVNLETLATLMYRYAIHRMADVESNGDLSVYADGPSTSSWAAEAVKWNLDHGIFTTRAGESIGSKDTVSRARLAVFLQRLTAVLEE